MRFIVFAAILFGIYHLWTNPSTLSNMFSGSGVHEITVENLGYRLTQDRGKKVVLLFSSDWQNCACQSAAPAMDDRSFPGNINRYIIALDKDKKTIDAYRKQFTNHNVTWLWLGKACTTPTCDNLIGPLHQMGINWNGRLPCFEIYDGTTSRAYPQSPPAESIACLASGTCTFNCVGQSCSVKQ